MRSKEAVTAVLNHRQPEYIPIGMYAIDCDTVKRIIGHETYVRDKIRTQVLAQNWRTIKLPGNMAITT